MIDSHPTTPGAEYDTVYSSQYMTKVTPHYRLLPWSPHTTADCQGHPTLPLAAKVAPHYRWLPRSPHTTAGRLTARQITFTGQ